MRTLFITLLAVLALPLTALAAASTVTYSSPDNDFNLTLPSGVLRDSYSDPDWKSDDSNTVLRWEPLKDDVPIKMVMVSAMDLGRAATDDDIGKFVDGYKEGATSPGVSSVESTSDVQTIGSRGWVSILARDDTDKNAPVWFEAWVTRQGNHVYTVIFFYTDKNGPGPETAKDWLKTFSTSQG